jgi:flagellar basal-body rod modification protein FlgD
MSTITGTLPTTTGTSSTSQTNTAGGFGSLTPQDFVQMMVTQLQNQDPLDPTNSQDILSQISQIGQLQTSDQLQTTLTGLSLQQQIGSASSMIGKSVKGFDTNNNAVSGNVTSVSVSQATNTVTLNLDSGSALPLGNVTAISQPAPATTSGTAAAAATNTTVAPQAQPAPATGLITSPIQSLLSAVSSATGL